MLKVSDGLGKRVLFGDTFKNVVFLSFDRNTMKAACLSHLAVAPASRVIAVIRKRYLLPVVGNSFPVDVAIDSHLFPIFINTPAGRRLPRNRVI